jgi:hypothetical protein
MIVMKFGGTSVEDRRVIERLAEIVCARLREHHSFEKKSRPSSAAVQPARISVQAQTPHSPAQLEVG